MRRTSTDSAIRGEGPQRQPAHDPDSRNDRRLGSREHARRRSLLREDPGIDIVEMPTLVAIARAIEDEAIRRYAMLAELMDSRGQHATAAAFRAMLEEERRHAGAVERWASALGEPGADIPNVEWQLPGDLSSSWDEVAASALLTPYRALALAVENEERAFAFYSYLAAHAADERIRAEAEKLGTEELRHATLLRTWRRRAYHAERRTAAVAPPGEARSASPTPPGEADSPSPSPAERGRAGEGARPTETLADLESLLTHHHAAIAATHLALAQRLHHAGDPDSAGLLQQSAASLQPTLQAAPTPESAIAPDADDPRHLLIDAQKPLEALATELEAVMATSEGDLFQRAAAAMDQVVKLIAAIALRTGSLRAP